MSCALRRLTGIVSVNVLMGHQAREIVFWSCFRRWNREKFYFHSLSISNKKYDDLQSIYNMSATLSFKILQRSEI